MARSQTMTDAIGEPLERLMTLIMASGIVLLLIFGALTLRTYFNLTSENEAYLRSLDAENGVIGMLAAVTTLEAIHSSTVINGGETPENQNFDSVNTYFEMYRDQVVASKASLSKSMRENVSTMLEQATSQRDGIVTLRDLRDSEGDDRGEIALRKYYSVLGQGRLMDPFVAYRQEQTEFSATKLSRIKRLRQQLVGLAIASLITSLMIGVGLVFYIRRYMTRLAQSQSQIRSALADTVTAIDAKDVAVHEQERVETLLEEMNHRIGNSLGMVSALMGLQRSGTDSVEVREALDAARTRIHAVATAHRRLRLAPDMETTDLAPVLADMANDLRLTQPRQDIELVTDFVNADVSDRDAVTLGLLMSELIVNAFKHAFVGRDGGTVWAETYFDADASFVLRVQDDGIGISGGETGEAPAMTGLGSSVVARMSSQFGGTLDYAKRTGGGTCIALIMPKLKVAAKP